MADRTGEGPFCPSLLQQDQKEHCITFTAHRFIAERMQGDITLDKEARKTVHKSAHEVLRAMQEGLGRMEFL